MLAGEQYLKLLETGLGARADAMEYGCAGLWKRVDGHLAAIRSRSTVSLTARSTKADISILRGAVRRVWFPAQSKIAEFMGDARVRRIGVYLIRQQQLEEMRKHLEPGDVIL